VLALSSITIPNASSATTQKKRVVVAIFKADRGSNVVGRTPPSLTSRAFDWLRANKKYDSQETRNATERNSSIQKL
jgi:hypothetical protein